jgi:hypothetical protein
MAILPGFSLDLTTIDSDGPPWDFDVPEMRRRALNKLYEEKPMFAVTSPMCAAFSALQNLSVNFADPLKRQRLVVCARLHMAFAMEICRRQHEAGRYFLRENPASAISWYEECVRTLMTVPGIAVSVCNQCLFGQFAIGSNGVARPAMKPTRWMSNSSDLLEALSKRCSRRGGVCGSGFGLHVPLVNGRAKAAAIYPLKLCRAILIVVSNQMRRDMKTYRGQIPINTLNSIDKLRNDDDNDNETNDETYWDELTGEEFKGDLVKKARRLELDYFKSKAVCKKRPKELRAWRRSLSGGLMSKVMMGTLTFGVD